MKTHNLPQRVFNSPCIEFVNFKDGSHMNLIKLKKPYANGNSYAIHETTEASLLKSRMFKTLKEAETFFNAMVQSWTYASPIRNRGTHPQHY